MSQPPLGSQLRVRVAVALLAIACSAPAFAACGSRGPLDGSEALENDASDLDVGTADVQGDAVESGRPKDSGPPREAGVVQCGLCVAQECAPGIVACIQNPACTAVFQCVVATCLIGNIDGGGGGGGLNPVCLFQCGAGNLGGALQVFAIFQCITNTCGPECGPLLGNFIGGGGFPGGGAGGAGRNNAEEGADHFRATFSPWPELLTPATTR